MAIYGPLTTALRSEDLPLQTNATLAANGQAVIGSVVNNTFGIATSAGASGERFFGFVNAQTSAAPFLQLTASKVEQTTLPSAGTFTLGKVPVTGTLAAYDLTAAALISSGSYTLDASGNFTYSAGAGHAFMFTYTYALSVSDARAKYGDVQPGGYAGYVVNQASIMRQGTVYTDQFDTTVDWTAATGIKLAAAGKVTNQAGSGVTINAQVVSIPTIDRPFLGITFTAA